MSATIWRRTGLGQGMKRLVDVVQGERDDASQAARPAGEPVELYVHAIFQSLAVYRFMSFTMGAGLVFGLNPAGSRSIALLVMVGIVGLYNIYRVAVRFDPTKHRLVTRWLALGIDVALAVTLILMSDGLDSPFLLYSLSPVLTASLLMELRSAVQAAGVLALSISGPYLSAGFGVGDYPWVLSRNYLAFSLLYSAVCLLMAYLPFLANLNWQRRVRAESLHSEWLRLRREVHDNVAQTLAFLSLKVKRAEERASEPQNVLSAGDVKEIGSAVERAYLAVRDYLDGAEEAVDNTPLGSGLKAMVDQWKRDTGLSVVTVTTGDEQQLPPRVKYQLLQITREALANVAKHSYATNVRVDLEFTSKDVTLRVRDDGRGFSTSGGRGHGMEIMNERTALVGGSLTIRSAPDEGSEVVVAFPRETEKAKK